MSVIWVAFHWQHTFPMSWKIAHCICSCEEATWSQLIYKQLIFWLVLSKGQDSIMAGRHGFQWKEQEAERSYLSCNQEAKCENRTWNQILAYLCQYKVTMKIYHKEPIISSHLSGLFPWKPIHIFIPLPKFPSEPSPSLPAPLLFYLLHYWTSLDNLPADRNMAMSCG